MTDRLREALLENLLALVDRADDPAARLRMIRELEEGTGKLVEDLRARKRATILELREQDPRPTWDAIGELLGVSGQRAHELAK